MPDMGQILVVDDDADTAEATAEFLRRLGHHVRSVPNGREALAALSETVPDVAVLDVRMPEMDGITFLEVMRCYLRWETVPVILITGYPDDPRLARARKLGVKRVFTKAAFELHELAEFIDNLLAGQQGARSPA